MKKTIMVILLAILSGLLFSLFIFNKYENYATSISYDNVYFIEQGVYSNYNNMVKNTEKLEKYTYEKIDDKYHVYVCVTLNKNNMQMIKKYFKSLNYSVKIKEKEISNIKFLNILKDYDYLLSSITKEETVKNICSQVVKKYEEFK